MSLRTPSQTVGPFFHVGLKWEDGNRIAFAVTGTRVMLTGQVYDGAGALVADALIETWQAGPDGKAPTNAPGAKPAGYGRAGTDAEGRYSIETVMPGACTGPGGEKYAPQLQVTIFARGLLKALHTRVFLAEPEAIKDDPLARAAGARAATLTAKRDAADPQTWRWDIRLQGKDETVFIES